MVIDSSALIALLLAEPERDAFAAAIEGDTVRLMSSVAALETATVILARKGMLGLRELDHLLFTANVEVVAFTAEQLLVAREAMARFGRGRHPAGLNMGDCCSYALSVHTGEPLLYKGDDFPRTDVVSALRP